MYRNYSNKHPHSNKRQFENQTDYHVDYIIISYARTLHTAKLFIKFNKTSRSLLFF